MAALDTVAIPDTNEIVATHASGLPADRKFRQSMTRRALELLEQAIEQLKQGSASPRDVAGYELRLEAAGLAAGKNLINRYGGALTSGIDAAGSAPIAEKVDALAQQPGIEVVDAQGPADWYREYEAKIRAELAHGGYKTRRQLIKAMRSMRAKKDRVHVVVSDLIASGVLVENKRNNGAWQLRLATPPNGTR